MRPRAQGATLQVVGYREFLRACDNAQKDSKRYVRETFREVGEDVQRDAAKRFSRYSAKSAAGYRTRVRQTRVLVEQSLRKTTGTRSDFGALQMRRALNPAVTENEESTTRKFEHAMDKIADHFESRP